jgi:NitT/TauT family transport system permease protein
MTQPRYQVSGLLTSMAPNIWDIVVSLIVLGILAAIAWGSSQMSLPYQVGAPIEISLDPMALPGYALSSVLRMFIAMFFSLLVTFAIAPLAAKNRHAEKFLIPLIDILQSVPVLGMLSITVVGFIHLFPNSLLGPECAAIFAIFTSQVWNMILSLYQSLRTIPYELKEVARMYHLSAWQKFWKLEVPCGTQSLIWNTMVSMSAGWFYVVLSEAIVVSNQNITLPGIGSYIDKAIHEADLKALGYAIIAMFVVILIYDQLLFRPLLCWAEKFHEEIDEETASHESWFFNLLAKTRLLKTTSRIFSKISDWFVNGYIKFIPQKSIQISTKLKKTLSSTTLICWNSVLTASLILACIALGILIHTEINLQEVIHVFYLGLITATKVVVLIILASLLWIPIGVWIGLNPRVTVIVQPLIQFVSAFPANLFYPLFVIVILKYNLNKNLWTMPLMILGTQWYILFNVISGTASIPKDIRLAVKNFGVKGTLWWRRMVLPSIFPHYVTGAMTAAGGCWNASIVAEYVEWGGDTIMAQGLGQYITLYTHDGDFPRIALGIGVMSIYVMFFTHLVWKKLYQFSADRFTMDT